MAEIKISCSHCSQHIQCDESYGGQQIKCPSCSQPLLIPQIVKSEPLPTTPIPGIKRRQKPDYVTEAKNWDSDEHENTPQIISPIAGGASETSASWNPAAATCMVLGVICYAFGVVDFAGMPFHYDITGVSWSPIVAGLIGSAMVGAGYKLNKGREPISKSAITITLILVGLVTASSIYYFSSGGRLFTPISSLESQVKADIQIKLAQDPATSSIQIKSFSLVHESGNKYKGILEAQTDGKKESAEVEVTYDGRSFMWKILPQLTTDNDRQNQNSSANTAVQPGLTTGIDPATGKSVPAVQVFDPKTGKTGLINPENGLPLESATEQPADMPQIDPATGLPLAPADSTDKVQNEQSAPTKNNDDVVSIEKLKSMAEQGDADAQYKLASCYHMGRGGITQDYQEALKWYRKAANQGNAGAQANLGRMYDDGTGVPKNYQEAVKWYKLAADNGDAVGQNNLGVMYSEGTGVSKNYAEAAKWYLKSANQGYAGGQFNIGCSLADGSGVGRDYVEAYAWFSLAASQGQPSANDALDMVAKRMTQGQITLAQQRAASFVPKK